MRVNFERITAAALLFGVSLAPLAQAGKKPKTPPKDPQDQIEVVGHLVTIGGSIKRFVPTRHYSSDYVYAEHETGGSLTLIDVSKPAKPVILADTPLAPSTAAGSLVAVAGTAALVTSEPEAVTSSVKPQTVRIMDFSDPRSPRVAREFTGVTAVGRDERRGLIFLANGEGVWILQQHFATDPELEKAYAYHVVYDR